MYTTVYLINNHCIVPSLANPPSHPHSLMYEASGSGAGWSLMCVCVGVEVWGWFKQSSLHLWPESCKKKKKTMVAYLMFSPAVTCWLFPLHSAHAHLGSGVTKRDPVGIRPLALLSNCVQRCHIKCRFFSCSVAFV